MPVLISGRPAGNGVSVSPAEMAQMVARAGLTLNPGQMADLVLTWRQLAVMIAGIPRERPIADDLAFVFRSPPPASGGGEALCRRR